VRQYASSNDELLKWREGLDRALRTPHKRRRPIKVIAGGLVLLLVLAVGGAYMYSRVIEGLLRRTDSLTLASDGGKTLNFLLVGSDSREGLSDPADVSRFGAVGGKRADTIILAQLVPGERRGVLMHFPRDLYVTVHGGGRQFQSKINAAYGYGPQSVIDTVGNLTQIPIHHYMEVDIRGFRSMVDAIGGIDVELDAGLYDSTLNFRLPKGKSHLDGNKALSFVRARHATPDGDFGRIKRQQQFLKSVMKKTFSAGVIGSPSRVNDLARAFARNVTVDQNFEMKDFVSFALSFREQDDARLGTYSVPGYAAGRGGQSVVLMKDAEAQTLFAALRNGERPPAAFGSTQAVS
jgi:LCP family protein required for cell wall assembly